MNIMLKALEISNIFRGLTILGWKYFDSFQSFKYTCYAKPLLKTAVERTNKNNSIISL